MECVRSARCPLPALICLLLASPLLPGVRGQTLSVHQPQGSVSVSVGGSVTLNCTVTGAGPPGGVRWFRENGGPRKEFFSFVNQKPDRVSQVISGSSSDFSIIISITRQDNGTYTCVKFRKTAAGEKEFRSGGGTVLYVTGERVSHDAHMHESSPCDTLCSLYGHGEMTMSGWGERRGVSL
ncbi:hypothetical protein FKM82_007681 [Ascaphus truei]